MNIIPPPDFSPPNLAAAPDARFVAAPDEKELNAAGLLDRRSL